MAFDLSKKSAAQKADEGAWMQVSDQFGDPIDGFMIQLQGRSGKAYRKEFSAIAQKFQDMDQTIEAVYERECELLAALSRNWQGVQDKGKDVAFSRDTIMTIYLENDYIKRQAEKFVIDLGNGVAAVLSN